MINKLIFCVCAFMLAIVAVSSGAWAEDGHNHGGGAVAIVVAPRTEARLENLQVVLVYANRRLYEDKRFQFFGNQQIEKFADPRVAVFLENLLTGEPTTGAELEATINFIPEPLKEIAPGVYVSENIVLGGGRNEIDLAYTIGDKQGVLPMTLVVPGGQSSGASVTTAVAPPVKIPDWVFAIVIIGIYAGVTAIYVFRQKTRPSIDEPDTAHASLHAGSDRAL